MSRHQKGVLLIALATITMQLGYLERSRNLARAEISAKERIAAAPGIIEPATKEREISAQVVGVIKEVKVSENEPVEAGQLIAVIENSEQSARVASAQAQVSLRQTELDRILHGARAEEVNQASAALDEADAAMRYAQQDYQRRLPLAKHGFTSQAVLDQAKANLASSTARRASAAQRLAQLKNGARPEDIEVARAGVRLAEAELGMAKAILDKTYVRSPVSGILLRQTREVGETVTHTPPTTIAIVGDLRGLRVRAEIDESDVGKVALGQRVEVVSDAFPGKVYPGKVTWVSSRMGSKLVSTGRPAERVDAKILQVLIDLDEGAKLPVGLRVDSYLYDTAHKSEHP